MSLFANLGVPMLFVQMPLMVGALPAVVFIEACLVRHWYALSWPAALKPVVLANLISTLLGFPLMWFVLAIGQAALNEHLRLHTIGSGAFWYEVVFKAPWLYPGHNQAHWMIPAACLVLLVPAFFMTVIVEHWVYRRAFADRTTPMTPRQATWRMHSFSYGFLLIAGLFFLTASLVKHQRVQASRRQSVPASNR